MTPAHERLLSLLVARGYRMAAEMNLQTALLIEEFESDRRSRSFERWFNEAVRQERMAFYVIGSGQFARVAPERW